MILSLYNAVDDAFAVLVVFVDIKIDYIAHVYELLISFEISAGLAHDDRIAVIDKVESPYSFYNSSCHTRSVPSAVARMLLLLFIAFFRLCRLLRSRFRTGTYLKVDGRALIELRVCLILLIDDISLSDG